MAARFARSGPNSPRTSLINAGLSFVGNALLPRLGYRLRWPSRLRGRGLLLWIGLDAAWKFGILSLIALFRNVGSDYETAKERLRAELGREPTRAELLDRVANDYGHLVPRSASAEGGRSGSS
jgi:hypothetical protein